MTNYKKYMAAALVAALPLVTTAQTNGSNSPYSRYGFGLLNDGGNAFNKGMAGTAYGMRDGKQLNTKNPASYTALDSLTFLFDFGMSLQNGNFSQNGVKTNAKNTSIDYVTAGFRIAPRMGMTLGLVPFSTIGYEMTSTTSGNKTDLNEHEWNNTFSGDGGLHTAYIGWGWAIIKPLSLGVNAGYTWGSIEHSATYSESSTTTIPTTQQTYSADIRTYKLDIGLQYEQRLNKKNSMVLGLTYGWGHDVNRKATFTRQSIQSSTIVNADTLNCNNAFQLPHTLGVGLTWNHNNSLRVGVDYTWQKWSNVKYPTLQGTDDAGREYVTQTGLFSDVHKVSLGAEYVPNAEGLHWRDRVRYRAGVSYGTSYAKINGTSGPHDFLASIGVSLPIINLYNNRTFVNFSAQYEHVKPKVAGMITENYLRFCIGITFNERWFMKWKAE